MPTPSVSSTLTPTSEEDPSTQSAGILGIINGHNLCPVGGKIFCVFQILSGNDETLDWKGFNIQTATCVYQEDFVEYLVTVTYKNLLSNPEELICYSARNIHHPTFTTTGFTYLTPHKPSYLLLALLPEGSEPKSS
jgi:hypothetical protein